MYLNPMLAPLLLLSSLALVRLIEFRMHHLNARYLRSLGAKETATRTTRVMWLLENACFLCATIEWIAFPKTLPFWQVHLALLLLMGSTALRFWARHSLGRLWSLGLIYVPGAERIKTGPYRFFSHPEYLSRFLENLGLALFLGSYLSFSLYMGACLLLLPRILIFERRQLSLLAN